MSNGVALGEDGSLRVLREVGRSLDLVKVLEQVVAAARHLLGAERSLVLLKEDGDDLVPRAWTGFDSSALEGVRFSARSGAFARILAHGRPLALETALLGEPGASELIRHHSGLIAPLAAGDRAVGVLLVAAATDRRFSRSEESLLQTLADQAAIAIEHAQLYREAMTRGERLATLVDLSQRVAAHRPYDDLLSLIAEEARRLLGATAAALRLVEGDELAMAVCAGDAGGITGPARLQIGDGLCGRVAASGSPLRLGDLSRNLPPPPNPPPHPPGGGGPDRIPSQLSGASLPDDAGLAALVGRGIRSYLGVPLLVRERVAGVLSVYGSEPHRFGADDVTLLAGFAGQAAVAVENARLVQQLLHAERLSAVGRIVAGVAHELNNPLAVVVGTADLLRREVVDPRVSERLQRISGQAQRAVKIVRSLLTLARRKLPRRAEVEVNRLLEDTLELEAYELRSAHVAVIRRFSPELPPVLGDPDQLQQVFTNLFLNAVEAMRDAHGGGTLTVATRRDGPGDRVVVTVADDGPGIPPRDIPRVFESFFTTKSAEKGTGLGLAICRQIVEGHAGRITLESGPGAGATFTVELPVARAGCRPPEEPARPERVAPCGVDVLVVEDERVVGDLLTEFLTLEGHRVDRAANGREALELAKTRAYSLIVSDVRMPDVDGPGLYHALRAADPDLPRRMLFVTGDVMSPDTRRFLSDTGVAYLEKPFGIAEFQAMVRGVLRHAGTRSAPTTSP